MAERHQRRREPRRLTRRDVVEGYRGLLGRAPENAEVIAEHVASGVRPRAFFRSLVNSPEFAERHRAEPPAEDSEPSDDDEFPYVVVPTRVGSMVVRSDDRYIGGELRASGDFYLDELTTAAAHAARHLGIDTWDTFVDVGANIGTHTLHAVANLDFRQAISLEPDPENYRILTANCALNGLDHRIRAVRAAASDREDVALLRHNPSNRGDHRLVAAPSADIHGELSWTSDEVERARLDDIVGALPENSLVWIDTQGHDAVVLRGASALTARGLPFAFEFWPYGMSEAGSTVDDVLTALPGYTMIDLVDPANPVVSADELRSTFDEFLGRESATGSPHTMILALPGAR